METRMRSVGAPLSGRVCEQIEASAQVQTGVILSRLGLRRAAWTD
jgi:hypothetical protein